ncbi:MAG: hypothetical protein JRI63_13865 [Deltaproteobacteria bacterium]|nr:hypothetical protein [Deltaproteobacteria bacterium]
MPKSKLTHKERQCLKRINWDYNISEEDIYDVITGKKKHAGHWDYDKILIRMLERLRWYDLLDIIGPETLKEKLHPEILGKIRFPEKKKKYERLGKILRGEAVSFTKWSPEYREEIKDSLFSNRWYSP